MAPSGLARRLTAALFVFTVLVLVHRQLLGGNLTFQSPSTFLGEPDREVPNGIQPIDTSPLASQDADIVHDAGPEAAGSQHDSDLCKDRYSTKHLDIFRHHRMQYCSSDSTTDLTCFHGVNSGALTLGKNERVDSFCLARNAAVFDVSRRKFLLDCRIRDLAEQERASGAIPYRELNSYQYLTGPRYLLKEWMDLRGLGRDASSETGKERSVVLLLKREVDGNMWHCLNEIMGIMTTLTVLGMSSVDSSSSDALLNPEDIASTQIVILDEHPDGPYFELFQMFSDKKPMRLQEWIDSRVHHREGKGDAADVIPADKVIIPYPGAANPLWTDWIPIDCSDNEMLRNFVQRIFDFYKLDRARSRPGHSESPLLSVKAPKLNVTIVVRKGSRKLMGLETYLFASAKAKFSDRADLRLVDFEGMPFKEQIQISRDTDVLVGMHGAGFSHLMFMEEGRGAAVEIQPDRLCHKGFWNLSKMMRIAHFIVGASKVVGLCYPDAEGKLEMMLADGTAMPHETSRCWTYTPNPADWSFACSDPHVTGGERSYMICESHTRDEWYQTCTKKEAADMWWQTEYIMEQERFLSVVGDAIDEVERQQR